MIQRTLDIPLKGERDYLHGTDIYDSVLQTCREQLPNEEIGRINLKFREFIHHQCELYLVEAGEEKILPDTKSTLKIETGQGRSLRGGLVETDLWPGRRVGSWEAEVFEAARCRPDTVRLFGPHEFPPIEALVFMTKKLHQVQFSTARGRWIFVALDVKRPLNPRDPRDLTVRIEANRNDRLTESSIQTPGGRLGRIYFSLVGAS